ncbi:hypothetical protein PG990_015484 [Apiospora arundinis]|uniref:LysR family regulatory protein n=1 Tax=Apiospora arundinis TaxID=335852 RepID=A0ABR2HNZ3_9PEZI
MGLFSANGARPPTVSSDDVTPLRSVDALYPVSFDFTLVFQDVLDVRILRGAADRLLRKEGWRQLGARLRRTESGELEYHLPAEFTEERPLFLFTTDRHDMSIRDHPVLCGIPKAEKETPTVYKSAANSFRPYMRSPTTPETFDDWLYNDIPQLAFHVVNFEDATIVTVTLLHTLTDAMGLMAFYRAWTATLRGDDDKIAPYIGYKDEDPLNGLQQGKQPPKYIFADRILQGWGFFKFVFRNIMERFWYPEASMRFVSIPGRYISKLALSAREDLAESRKDGDSPKPFLSDSDILCAWWTRLIVRALRPPPSRTVCLTNNFDSRDVLADLGLLPSANISLLANAAYSAPCFEQAGRYASTSWPLGLLAQRVRSTIQLHRTVEQVQAQDAALRESQAKTGHVPLYGDSSMLFCSFTNCHRGKLFQMDFSPAVITDGEQQSLPKSKSGRGRPVFINCTSMESRWSSRNATAILGRSEDSGDWWLECRLRNDVWEKIEQQLESIQHNC